MSRNIQQVFIDNPSTSMINTDLSYIGRSPYGMTDDSAILWSDVLKSINLGVTSPAEAIYISNDGNDTTGTGTIELPFATYAKAVSVVSPLANSTTPYAIIPIGIFNITGDMTLFPFVNINGLNHPSNFIISGQLLLDSTFDSTTNPTCYVSNCSISAASDINLTLTVYQNALIVFTKVDFSGTSNFNAIGSGTNGSPEIMAIVSCVSYMSTPIYNFTNILCIISGSSVDQGFNSINNSAITNNLIFMQNCVNTVGSISFISNNSAFQFGLLSSSMPLGSQLTIDGVNNFCYIDSSTYEFNFIFANGATISNVQIPSLADGLNANTNFSPSSYTPTAASNYLANSVTGNLSGIDLALSSKTSFIWNDVATNTQILSPNNGYLTNNGATLVNYTLPTTCPQFATIRVEGFSSGLYEIDQNDGQQILLGNLSTSAGVAGSLTATQDNDGLELLCIVADTTFKVSNIHGTFTVV